MNVYILELERGKDSQYISRRVVTRILSLTNMLGVSRIEAGLDLIDCLKESWQYKKEVLEKSDCIGYLADNPVYLKEEITGFIKIGEKDLKVIFE